MSVPDESVTTLPRDRDAPRERAGAGAREPPARESAGSLIEQHADLVYNLAVRLTGDREEARDLAQDAFVRILRSAGSFRGEASPKTWICRIVINCHRNRSRWWRRLKRGRAVSTVSLEQPLGAAGDDDRTVGSTLADPAPPPDRLFEADEMRGRLEEEIRKLPRLQRAALILREVEGLSYTEIARALGAREGTVKSRLARARETLRLALMEGTAHPKGGAR